jgi:hypothetical protein
MTGRERSRVLAVRCADPILSVIAPVALGSTRGTALIIDLGDQMGMGPRTLADLARDGPRLDELSPGRSGVAVLRSGRLPPAEVAVMAQQLAVGWPAVVIRAISDDWPGPIVPVHVLYPGWLAPTTRQAAVWQRLASGPQAPGPGPVLPTLGSRLVRRVLGGGRPGEGRWVRAWRQVWDLPWA